MKVKRTSPSATATPPQTGDENRHGLIEDGLDHAMADPTSATTEMAAPSDGEASTEEELELTDITDPEDMPDRPSEDKAPHHSRNPLDRASAALAERDNVVARTEDLAVVPVETLAPMRSDESLGALTTAPAAEPEPAEPAPPPATPASSPLFAPAPKSRPAARLRNTPHPNGVYALAALVSVFWAGSLLAFAYGFQSRVGPFTFDPFTTAIFGFLALGPVGLIGFSAFAFNQGARFVREAERAKALADDLATPVSEAAVAAGSVVASIRSEIDSATTAATRARIELTALRDGLAEETRRLLEAANESIRTTQHLSQVMGEEREALGRVTVALDHQADRVVNSVERQARMVAEASDLAETQLREAEAALTARAADLTTAADDASKSTQLAGQGLEQQIDRLETATRNVKDRMGDADAGMERQRVLLSETIYNLRTEQEKFEKAFADRQDQLSQLVSQSMQAAQAVTQSVTEANQQFDDLAESTIDRAEAIGDAARQHRAAIATAAVDSLGALTDASLRHRDMLLTETQQMIQAMVQAAEDTRRAADAQMSNVRAQIDQLGEASFTAGQQAEAMFEARLNEARSLIEQSARLAEEAGARSSEHLTEGLVSTRAVVAEFAELLANLEARMATLPQEAARQAQIVTSGLAQGLIQGIEDLTHSARRAAEDSQSFDLSFQDRVRRNYEALGVAVMQLEAMAKRPAAAAPQAQPAPAAPAVPAPSSAPRPVAGRPVLRNAAPGPVVAKPALAPAPALKAEEAQARPRLKLTPAAEATDPVRKIFEAPAPVQPPAPEPAPTPAPTPVLSAKMDQWSWKDLLTSLEDNAVDDDQLGAILIQEIQDMRIDTQTLLPRSRIDEIAAAINAGDYGAALDQVNGLANNSIRRLAKRLQSDRDLMVKAERFVENQSNIVVEASARDREGFLMPTLLSNELGRTYLLFAAALADEE